MREICFVANEPYASLTGGIPRFLRELAPRMAERFQVTVVVTGEGRGIERDRHGPRLTVVRFPRVPIPVGDSAPPAFDPAALGEIVRRSDLVFAQTVDCAVALHLSRSMRKPYLLYFHGVDWEALPQAFGSSAFARGLAPIVRAWSRYWMNRARLLLLPSESLRPLLTASRIHAPTRTVPLGVDTEHFRPAVDRSAWRKALGLPDEALVLGYVGRLAHEKNVKLLFRTFDSLATRVPNLHLLLVGPGLPEYFRRAGENPRIHAVGLREDVRPYLAAMDLFGMPSRTETSSLSTMEAMCAGLPVVANAVGCVPEYVRDGENGRLADPDEPASFAAAVLALLADAETRARLGASARRTMVGRSSWDRTAEALTDAFEAVLA